MRDLPDTILFRFLLAMTLASCIGSQAFAEEWPVKKFEVFLGPPTASTFSLGITAEQVYGALDDWVDIDAPTEPPPDVPATAIAEIESYLAEVAQKLEDTGFKPPLLVPMVRNQAGEPAYRVYYYPYGGSPARYRSSDCGRARPTISINANAFLDGSGQISPKNYQDLAHELFHAVQGAYPLFQQNCSPSPGGWITEGIAQALGADLAAYSSRGIDPAIGPGDWIFHRWGLRYYDRALSAREVDTSRQYESIYPGWEQSANVTYGASSFWRYVGEHVATSGAAGTAAVEPDYSYLIRLFNSSLGGSPGWDTEVAWIDRQLQDHPKIKLGLERIYPNFISTYAAYMTTRIKSRVGPQEARDAYLRNTFPERDCPVLRLNDQNPVSRIPLEIEPVAAECVRLELAFSYPTDVEFSISGASKPELKALAIGTEQGQVVLQPLMIPVVGEWRASFIFNVRIGLEPTVFIIANVADEAGQTGRLSAELQVAPTHGKNDLAPQGPMPPGPSNSPGPAGQGGAALSGSTASATAGQSQAGTTSDGELVTLFSQSERVGRQIEEGLQYLNPNMAHGNTVSRRPDAPPCGDAFQVHPCGPYTSIGLSMVPGLYGSMAQGTGRGGAFGQFASMLQGVAAAGPMETSDQLRAAAEFAKSVDGTDVHITIPLIDYGFTGSFNNAALTVSARGGGRYQAIGPADILPGPGREYPLSGQVTIEEYTPTLLRGSYSGRLVDTDRIDWENVGDDFTLPVHETIHGRFQIVAAWSGDGRIQVEQSEDAVESVYRDVAEMMPGLDPQILESIQEQAQQQNPAPSAGSDGGSSGGVIIQGCDCSCNAALDPQPECEQACAGTYAACAGLVATAAMRPTWQDLVKTVEPEAGDPFLRTLPKACDLLDSAAAAMALGTPEVRQAGVQEHLAQITSQCGYRQAQAGSGEVHLLMLFHSLDLYDSRRNSEDELRIKLRGFNFDLPLPEPVQGIGNKAYAMHKGGETTLVVLTGIYGVAMDSDDFMTELLATYRMKNADQEPAERLASLVAMARPQYEQLRRLALTTHQGDSGP